MTSNTDVSVSACLPCVSTSASALNANDFIVKSAPSTIRYIPNFINEEEEEYLLEMVNSVPKPKWDLLKNRRLQNWGGLVGKNGLIPDEGLPYWLEHFVDKLMAIENGFECSKRPNHLLVNEYHPGQGIMPHTDGPAFYPLIATISLGSGTMLDLYNSVDKDNTDEKSRYVGSMMLERRSLILISEDAYSSHLHGIAERDWDEVTGKVFNRPEDLPVGTLIPRSTRVSLTIRCVPNVKKINIMGLLMKG